MDKSLLIAVFVPTTDEKNADHKGKRGEIATGYPVGKDLILTARHVLSPEPPRYRDTRYLVKIRWHYFSTDWVEIPEEDIIWRSPNDLDAALIRCTRPIDALGWGILSCDRPDDEMQWVSEGFPRATRYEDVRNPSSFGGPCRSKAPQESFFELIEKAQPEQDEDWRGVSGMPVFVGRKILGVVQSVPPNFNAKKLYATPTWQLLEDEEFRREIGYDEQVARVKKVKGELIKILLPSPGTVETLVETMAMDEEIIGLEMEKRTEFLADRLLDMDVRVVIKTLRRAHRSMCKYDQNEEPDTDAAGVLVKAARLIVPAIYDYGVVKWTGSQQNIALVPLPAGIKTVAEIIMAGVDGRETRFRDREYDDDQPEGELSLPTGPEQGIDPGRIRARVALQDHLSRKFSLEETETRRFRGAVDDFLLTHFPQAEPGAPKRNREKRIESTANLLSRKRKDSGQTFYMLFYLPEDVSEQNALRALVQSLKDDYPAIMFLGLDPDFDQEQQDRDLVDPLCRMLPVKPSVPSNVTTPPEDTNHQTPSMPTPVHSDYNRAPPGAETDSIPIAPSEGSPSMSGGRFQVALSFPGEHRNFVEQVAARLTKVVGKGRVLYDRYYEAEFARPDLDTYLQHLYHQESELIAVFLCADYERKEWCGLEWRAVRDLIKQRQASTVMPLRFDNTEIPGLLSTDGYVWIGDDRTPQEIADLILQRMKINAGNNSFSSSANMFTSPEAAPLSWKRKIGGWMKKVLG